MLSDEDEPIDLTADIAKINAAGDAEDAAVTKKLVDTFENERKGFGTILTETLTGAAVGGGIGAVGVVGLELYLVQLLARSLGLYRASVKLDSIL